MMSYDWPGNVRELENSVEHARTMGTDPVLSLGDLPTSLQLHAMETRRANLAPAEAEVEELDQVMPLAEAEKKAILSAIRILNGDKLRAARMPGIGKTTLYRKLKEYGIADPLRDG
jgi:DNA-binding NtrC family response regulator